LCIISIIKKNNIKKGEIFRAFLAEKLSAFLKDSGGKEVIK